MEVKKRNWCPWTRHVWISVSKFIVNDEEAKIVPFINAEADRYINRELTVGELMRGDLDDFEFDWVYSFIKKLYKPLKRLLMYHQHLLNFDQWFITKLKLVQKRKSILRKNLKRR